MKRKNYHSFQLNIQYTLEKKKKYVLELLENSRHYGTLFKRITLHELKIY